MNIHKKIFHALWMGLTLLLPQAYAANGNFTQLDQAGINIIFELTNIYNRFAQEPIKPDFDLTQWNFLLKTNIKNYVEDYSTAVGIQDKELIQNLNLLLQTNDTLMQQIEKVKNYKIPGKTLSSDEIRSHRENLIKPFLQMRNTITDQIIPALKQQSYYVSIDRKNKAKEILIRSFNLINQISQDMTIYTSKIIASSGVYQWQDL